MSYLTDGNACNVFVRWPLVKTGRAGRPLARISWADLLEPVVCELPLAACASRGCRIHYRFLAVNGRAADPIRRQPNREGVHCICSASVLLVRSGIGVSAASCIAGVRHVSPLTQTQSEHQAHQPAHSSSLQ